MERERERESGERREARELSVEAPGVLWWWCGDDDPRSSRKSADKFPEPRTFHQAHLVLDPQLPRIDERSQHVSYYAAEAAGHPPGQCTKPCAYAFHTH